MELLQTAEKRRRKSILLIDDDRGVRSAISQALKKQDYDLIEAGSPDAAASIWSDRQDEIDLILLDVVLPGLSGPELANEMMEHARAPQSANPKAPIIYITGLGKENLEKFQVPQDARLLLKPFRVGELREMVADTLSGVKA